MDLNAANWTILKDFIAEWYRPLEPKDGCTAEELEVAEAKLGRRLPEELRLLYLMMGRCIVIVDREDRLIEPGQLRIRNGYLPFWEENQGVWYFAIAESDLDQSSPKVAWLLDGGVEDFRKSVPEAALLLTANELMTVGNFGAKRRLDGLSQTEREQLNRDIAAKSAPLNIAVLDENMFFSINGLLGRISNDFEILAHNEDELAEFIAQYPQLTWSENEYYSDEELE